MKTLFLDWLQNNYLELQNLAHRIDNQHGEEVLHFTLEKFLTKDYEFLDNLDDFDKLKYMSRTMSLQSKSESSQYYREVKRFTVLSKDVILEDKEEHNDENDEINEIKILFIQQELKKINWFSSLLFTRYIETGYSAQKLADQLLIPLSTCQYHIRKVKTHIRTEWDKRKDNLIL
jgi:hypothetical protein